MLTEEMLTETTTAEPASFDFDEVQGHQTHGVLVICKTCGTCQFADCATTNGAEFTCAACGCYQHE